MPNNGPLTSTCVPRRHLPSFSFDGRLQAHIDVRKREHVMFVEMVLPTLEERHLVTLLLGLEERRAVEAAVGALH